MLHIHEQVTKIIIISVQIDKSKKITKYKIKYGQF